MFTKKKKREPVVDNKTTILNEHQNHIIYIHSYINILMQG